MQTRVVRRICVVGATVIGAVLSVAGAERKWKTSGAANDWDWTNGANFEEGVPPGPDDKVVIGNALSVRLKGSDEESWAVFNKLSEVQMTGAWDKRAKTSRLIIDTDTDKTISVPLSAGDRYMRGMVIKRGTGKLSLSAAAGDGGQKGQSLLIQLY